MINSALLDVFIGLAFFYLLISLVLASINEILSGILKTRTNLLEKAILKMFREEKLVEYFYNHPLINGISSPNKSSLLLKFSNFVTGNKITRFLGISKLITMLRIPPLARRLSEGRPSYIASRTFSAVLIDLLDGDYVKIKKRFATEDEIDHKSLKKIRTRFSYFSELVDKNDPDTAQHISEWFDDQMERVTGWYKRLTQKVLLVVALIFSIALNADTLMMANLLWNDSAVRAAVLLEAEAAVDKSKYDQTEASTVPQADLSDPCRDCASQSAVDVAINSRHDRPMPIGWATPTSGTHEAIRSLPYDFAGWFYKITGILITTFLVSLGAPFWFDMLSKFVNLRNAGLKPKSTRKNGAPS